MVIKILCTVSDKQRHTSSLRRNVLYPIAMILLLGLTVITVLIAVQNTMELLIGIKALPLSSRVSLIALVMRMMCSIMF